MELPKCTITLEEHVAMPSLSGWTEMETYAFIGRAFPAMAKKITDCSTGRIANMDSANISFQVMSHIPNIGVAEVAGCRGANDKMTDAVKRNSSRLAEFAGKQNFVFI